MKAPTSFQLPVSPLPTGYPEGSQENPFRSVDGFVDDDVIASIITAPVTSRRSPAPSDLILSSDENDFAGWSVPSVSPFRVIAEKQEKMQPPPSREELPEPGLGKPHRGNHRWWVAAATSVASALIFSLLFAGLADRGAQDGGMFSSLSAPMGALQSALGSLVP